MDEAFIKELHVRPEACLVKLPDEAPPWLHADEPCRPMQCSVSGSEHLHFVAQLGDGLSVASSSACPGALWSSV